MIQKLKLLTIILFSLIFSLILCELALRVTYQFITNYDIEMWKYAKKLKIKSQNNNINHTHINNKSAKLQKVEIKINNLGQRDQYIDNQILKTYNRTFIVLGSSITFGWGVQSKNTFSEILNNYSTRDKKKWLFVNGGIGNYNTERYVNNYLENWSELEFTDIIIHFFINDTELLTSSETNFLFEHTYIGVQIWKLLNILKSYLNKENINDYYFKLYNEKSEGFKIAKLNMLKLKKFCDLRNINCHLVLMPDLNHFDSNKFIFIKEKVKKLATELRFDLIDLYQAFDMQNFNKHSYLNKYNDPHPNALGHKVIADNIYNHFNK
tara:strand:- start:9041 stop:10009 length:969 start_codon:yes stop_codon:yes gene_type:complete